MASLGEMVAAAQSMQEAKSRSNPLARMAERMLAGGFAGMESREQREKKRMDRYEQLLNIQEKEARMAALRRDQQITDHLLKGAGVLPPSASEVMRVRRGAWKNLGAGEQPPVNTESGRLMSMLGKHKLTGFKLSGGKLDFTFRDSSTESKRDMDPIVRREKIMKTTSEIAQVDWEEGQRGTALPGQTSFGRAPRDFVDKYLPMATAYIDGDSAAYEAEKKKLRFQWEVGTGGLDLDNLNLDDKEE